MLCGGSDGAIIPAGTTSMAVAFQSGSKIFHESCFTN